MKYLISLTIKLFKALNLKALQSKTQNIFIIYCMYRVAFIHGSIIATGRLVLEVAQHQLVNVHNNSKHSCTVQKNPPN